MVFRVSCWPDAAEGDLVTSVVAGRDSLPQRATSPTGVVTRGPATKVALAFRLRRKWFPRPLRSLPGWPGCCFGEQERGDRGRREGECQGG